MCLLRMTVVTNSLSNFRMNQHVWSIPACSCRNGFFSFISFWSKPYSRLLLSLALEGSGSEEKSLWGRKFQGVKNGLKVYK